MDIVKDNVCRLEFVDVCGNVFRFPFYVGNDLCLVRVCAEHAFHNYQPSINKIELVKLYRGNSYIAAYNGRMWI